MSISPDEITAVILAGGRGERMGGMDKGMLILHEKPLVQHVIDAIEPHVQEILLNANRHLDYYRGLGYPVVEDILGDYFGPLVGMATGMQSAATPLLVSVPCDSPFIPSHLVATLYRAMSESDAEISVAHDGTRLQPVYALLRCRLLPDLLVVNGGKGQLNVALEVLDEYTLRWKTINPWGSFPSGLLCLTLDSQWRCALHLTSFG